MSAMGSVEVRFTTEAEVTLALSRCDPDAVVIILFSSLESVEEAVRWGLTIHRLNVGHLPEAPGRTPIHPAVHLGPADFDRIERLQAQGVEVFVQPLPQDKAVRMPRKKEAPAAPAGPPKVSSRVSARLPVVNAKGLHLRAAHLLAHLAGNLPCEVQIGNDGAMVNAKSLLGLTTLGATFGTVLDVVVEGPDAGLAMEQIKALFESGFGEGADVPPARRKGEA
jgi:phosphocarrier protein